jgi:apolipoprotein N-acyltransferase
VAAAAEYGLYLRFLRDPLRTRDFEQVRPALKRWIKATGAWNVLVVVGCVIYWVAISSRHGHTVAWVAPPVGAVFGSALVLQLVVMPIARSARG